MEEGEGSSEPLAKRLRFVREEGTPNEWISSANQAVRFRLLEDWAPNSVGTELERDGSSNFRPEFTHQIFGDDEEIKGYKGLRIDVCLSARTFFAFPVVQYDAMQSERDDIVGKMRAAWGTGLSADKEEFIRLSSEQESLDLSMGKVVSRKPISGGEQIVIFTRLSTAQAVLRDLHARLEPLLLYFVDAAARIDVDDPKWEMFLAVETKGEVLRLVGFCTVYNFYVFPDRVRKRLAQILVLPPYQRCGVGTQLVKAVFTAAKEENAVDVTLEDPTDSLRQIRDRVALRIMLSCKWLMDIISQHIPDVNTKQEQRNDSTNDNHTDAQEEVAGSASNSTDTTSRTNAQTHRLAIPGDIGRRVQDEIKIPHCQVSCLWEALLYKKAMDANQDVTLVESLIKHRLQTLLNVNNETQKVVFDDKTPDGNVADGFILLKCRNLPQMGRMNPPITSEYTSQEQKEALLANAVKDRMVELHALISGINEGC